jgi:hypothetical protein
MTLYEINKAIEDAILNIYSQVDEETGEVSDEAMQALTDLQMARDEKLENIGCYIKNLEAEAKAIKEEEKALEERRQSTEKKAERLSSYVTEMLGGEKWSCPRVAFSFRKSEQVTTIDDISLLPDEYCVIKTERKADKKKIKEAIKAGIEVSGAWLTEKINLNIK